MKRLRTTALLAILSFLIGNAEAQISQAAKVPVSVILGKIKTAHKVSFIYKESNVKNKMLLDTFNLGKSTDILMGELAAITGLRFEKIADGYYSISSIKNSTETNDQSGDSSRIISGVIYDEENRPMEGVSVRIGNSTQGTASDKEGRYLLRVNDLKGVLVFSFTGYAVQELSPPAGKVLNVHLKTEASELNDVIVIGYGQVKRKDVTGAISKVNMKDLEKAPVRSFEEALAGRVAGVQVSSNDGQPGSPVSIIVRGQNSITQDNSPLYVIDGFPLENPENNAVNPEDIESIEILKDASATAIYGARGANGVILITSKKGKQGPPVIRYNGYYGLQHLIRKMDLLSPYEFVKYELERQPSTAATLYLTNGAKLDDYRQVQGIDWQDEMFRSAPMQSHTLSVSGGTKATKYTITGSLLDQQGILINSGYKRAQTRFTLDQTINSTLKAGINFNYSALKKYGNSPIPTNGTQFTSGLMYNILGYRPITGTGDDDLANEEVDPDLDLALDFRYNPKLSAENELRNNLSNVLFLNGYIEQTLTKNLKLNITAGITVNNSRNEEFNNSRTRFGSPNTPQGIQRGINGAVINSQLTNYLNENTITYNKSFNANSQLNAVAGFTVQGIRTISYGAGAQHVPNEALGISGLDEGIPVTIASTDSKSSMASLLGRINYTYKSRYLFTGSFRADGSSKFATNNKWSYFPSGAFAWRLGKERFMEPLKFISDVKLRTSYGVTGNNRVTDFAYLSSIELPTSAIYPFNNAVSSLGSHPATIGNPNLKWENTRQFDAGIDLSLFNSIINIEIDYYSKKTANLLLNASVPPSLGFDNAFKNIGKVQNNGWEFSLNTTNIKRRDFTWSSGFNISFNQNKVLELSQNQETLLTNINWDITYRNLPLYIARIDRPIALFYGYIWEGNYQYGDFDKTGSSYILKPDITTNGSERASIQPGDIKYKDINGDGVVDANDMTVIGNPNPDFIGGFSNNFTVKNFDLNVFFQFSYGSEILNANKLIFEGGGRVQTNMFASYKDRWSADNQNNIYYRANGQGPAAYSTRVVEDGSFVRLKTISFGYNIPVKVLKRVGLKNCRLYASAQNLVTWTNYRGFDPEVSGKNSALTPAFDYSVYPRAKTITGGINITL